MTLRRLTRAPQVVWGLLAESFAKTETLPFMGAQWDTMKRVAEQLARGRPTRSQLTVFEVGQTRAVDLEKDDHA